MKIFKNWRLVCLCGLLAASLHGGWLLGADADQPQSKTFRAGAAMADITPPMGETVVGSFAPFPCTQVHDPLHARCLALDDGRTRLVLVICDNLGIAREICDQARRKICDQSGLPPQNVLIAATHTHSATRATSPRYRPILVRGIVDAASQALANLQPARIGWGGVDEPSEVFNRRWFVSDPELAKNPFGGVDKVRMNPPRGHAALIKPAGPIDPEISFISVQSRDGRPIALLANYSLHYVGHVNKGDISADYFGIFAERIGQLLGADQVKPPFVGIMTNGTSGDINNINFRQRTPRLPPYEKMKMVAEKVAQRVREAHDRIQFHDWVPLGAACRERVLRVRKPDEQLQKYMAEVMAKPEDAPKHHRYERVYAQRLQNLLDGPDEVAILLQAIRIGDLGIAAIPFEVFAEIGLDIKKRSPFGDAFTIEQANGSYGYLPTPRQHQWGGYETWMGTNRVQLDASELITQDILDMMAQLKQSN